MFPTAGAGEHLLRVSTNIYGQHVAQDTKNQGTPLYNLVKE
jgi:hypothetical protein